MIGLIGPALVIHELGKFVHHFRCMGPLKFHDESSVFPTEMAINH